MKSVISPLPTRGFSLFELLVVLLIVGALAASGLHALVFRPDQLEEGIAAVVRLVSEARSRAVLLHTPVVLEVQEQALLLRVARKQRTLQTERAERAEPAGPQAAEERPQDLPLGVRITAINGFLPDFTHGRLVFQPFGVVRESVLHLEYTDRNNRIRRRTVYVPSLGSAQIFEDHRDLEYILKELS